MKTVGFVFQPASIQAAPGETIAITLTNEDTAPHTLTSEEIGLDVKVEGSSTGSGSFTVPSEPGNYTFHCHIHPDMTGELIVGEGGAGHGSDHSPDTGEGDEENDDGY